MKDLIFKKNLTFQTLRLLLELSLSTTITYTCNHNTKP